MAFRTREGPSLDHLMFSVDIMYSFSNKGGTLPGSFDVFSGSAASTPTETESSRWIVLVRLRYFLNLRTTPSQRTLEDGFCFFDCTRPGRPKSIISQGQLEHLLHLGFNCPTIKFCFHVWGFIEKSSETYDGIQSLCSIVLLRC